MRRILSDLGGRGPPRGADGESVGKCRARGLARPSYPAGWSTRGRSSQKRGAVNARRGGAERTRRRSCSPRRHRAGRALKPSDEMAAGPPQLRGFENVTIVAGNSTLDPGQRRSGGLLRPGLARVTESVTTRARGARTGRTIASLEPPTTGRRTRLREQVADVYERVVRSCGAGPGDASGVESGRDWGADWGGELAAAPGPLSSSSHATTVAARSTRRPRTFRSWETHSAPHRSATTVCRSSSRAIGEVPRLATEARCS